MQFEYDLIAFGHKDYLKRYKSFLRTVQQHDNTGKIPVNKNMKPKRFK